jgi:hypothetical protein
MNKVYTGLFLILTIAASPATAQYAPQAPLPGNEAIPAADSRFVDWASGCTFYRGWLDIADKPLGQPTMGNEASVTGMPDANVLSLGDSGIAVVTFPHTIKNGDGPDFAIFENGFANPLNAEMAYLEFAFVEVSSDGQHFVRFAASSLTPDTAQVTNFTYMSARKVHNLAGKYISGYGTAFDLEELKDSANLDVNNISHIRLVDVVGSLDPQYGSYDKEGNIINDPYPSVYPSGGFDLNAIGVIHSNKPTGINPLKERIAVTLYPNPVTDRLFLETSDQQLLHFQLTDVSGKILSQGTFKGGTALHLREYATGLYLLRLDNGREKAVFKVNKH